MIHASGDHALGQRGMPGQQVYFVTHPDVLIDPAVPVPDWPLSPRGRERMFRALALPWVAGLGAVWCSAERKARDAAAILAGHRGLPVEVLAELGENDRSATGYLPRPEFEAVADRFFAHPEESIRGWERAANAQNRIIGAVERVVTASAGCGGDIAILAHGGVGALLLARLRGEPISRRHDQPPGQGGHYFVFAAATGRLRQGWIAIDPPTPAPG
jgi:broad specificity phosphatase PhoE